MKILLFFIIFPIIVSNIFGAFQFTNVASRANGLGNAFTGLADDSSASLFNPAGLRQILNKNILFSYFKPYLGLEDIDLSFVCFNYTHPVSMLGNFGLMFMQYNGDNLYRENLIMFTFAGRLNDYFRVFELETLAGINLKLLSHTYMWDDNTKKTATIENNPVVLTEDSKSGFTADLGFLFRLSKFFYCGVSLKNLTQPDIGIKYKDIVPMKINTGISFRKPLEGKYIKSLNITYDLTYRNQEWGEISSKLNHHTGAELWLNSFGIRCGINSNNFAFGTTYLKEIGPNLGIKVDYSLLFHFNLIDNFGSHNLSLTLSFGKPVEQKEIEEKIELKEIFEEKQKTPEEKLREKETLKKLLEIE